MMILRAYVLFAVLRGVAGALAVFVAVLGSVDLVAQLDDVGVGDYGLADAIAYVLLGLPHTIVSTLPAAALIGSLLALGNLAVHRELVVMRASGVSSFSLLTAVALAGFALAVLMGLLGESLAPSLGAYATEMRTRAMHEDVGTASPRSTWIKDGDRIVSLRRQAGELGYGGGVLVFTLGPNNELEEIAQADSADIGANDEWVLSNYAETSFLENGVATRSEREAAQTYSLNPDLVALSVVDEDELDTPALRRYIAYLHANDLDARRYEIAYWTRLSNMASVILMTALALPFVLGGLRTAGTGGRLLVGLLIGLAYYVIGEVLANSGEVFALDPRLVAWTPSAALLLVTVVAVARAR